MIPLGGNFGADLVDGVLPLGFVGECVECGQALEDVSAVEHARWVNATISSR